MSIWDQNDKTRVVKDIRFNKDYIEGHDSEEQKQSKISNHSENQNILWESAQLLVGQCNSDRQ